MNEKSYAWGGPPVLLYFEQSLRDDWGLASGVRQIDVGDRLWVYASDPHQRIVGVGLIVRPFTEVSRGFINHRIDIEWDLDQDTMRNDLGR